MKVVCKALLWFSIVIGLVGFVMPETTAKTPIKIGTKCTKLNERITTATRDILQCKRDGKSLHWKLIGKAPALKSYLWQEEFDAKSGTAPDEENWTALVGNGYQQLGLWSYGTGELESNLAEAAATDGQGNLVITARYFQSQWTSARHWTQGKVNFKYGKIEARIKMPTGSFNWPAFWMLGSNYSPPNQMFGTTPWPTCGEVDIVEGLDHNRDYRSTIHANVANTSDPWNWGAGLSAKMPVRNPLEKFHTYAILWEPNSITFTVDGHAFVKNLFDGQHVIQTAEGRGRKIFDSEGVWPFNAPFFLIINNAISPAAGAPTGNLMSKMYIDWIRYSKYKGYGEVVR